MIIRRLTFCAALFTAAALSASPAAARSAHEKACWKKHVESVLGKVRYAEGPPYQAFVACRDAKPENRSRRVRSAKQP